MRAMVALIVLLAINCHSFELIIHDARLNLNIIDEAVVPLQIIGAQVGDYAGLDSYDASKKGLVNPFSVSIEGEGLEWLKAEARPEYDERIGLWHWKNRQSFWLELAGEPPAVGHYSGVVQVCKETECHKGPFEFNVYEEPGVSLGFADLAASHENQVEMDVSVFNRTDADYTLKKPYVDYYLTKGAYQMLEVNVWSASDNYCLEVYDCSNNNMIMRHRVNQDVILHKKSGVRLFNDAYLEWGAKNQVPLGDKQMDGDGKDWSYPMSPLVYEDAAQMRRRFGNPYMVLASDGKTIWGNAPDWAANCTKATVDIVYKKGSESKELCPEPKNNSPIFKTKNDEIDVIYQGEDYAFLPEVNDMDGDNLTFSFEGPPWLEVGTPADFQPTDRWPFSSTAYKKQQYVRSVYQLVRQNWFVKPGDYDYVISVSDGKGGEAKLKRNVRVLPMSDLQKQTKKRVAVLTGDETWFRPHQLDIATGLVNLGNSTVTLQNSYYDYYINWSETYAPFHRVWYVNNGFTVDFKDCGKGHWRVRHRRAGDVTLSPDHSHFDNKVGIFQKGWFQFDKTNDPSFQTTNTLSGADYMMRRHYNKGVVLYNGDGSLEWGTPPSWAANCPDDEMPVSSSSSVIVSSSSQISSSSSATISSSSGTVSSSSSATVSSSSVVASSSSQSSVFGWIDRLKTTQLQAWFKKGEEAPNIFEAKIAIRNAINTSVNLKGYSVRYYLNGNDMLESNELIPELWGRSGTKIIERCGENEYAIRINMADDAFLYESGSYEFQVALHKQDWSNIPWIESPSYIPSVEWTSDPAITIYDPNGKKVFGTEPWPCNGYKPKELALKAFIGDVNAGADGGYSSSSMYPKVTLKLANTGTKDLAAGATVDFLFSMETGLYPIFSNDGKESVTLSEAGAGQYVVRWTLTADLAAGSSHGVAFTLKDQCAEECVAEGKDWPYPWQKKDDYSLLYKTAAGTLALVPSNEVVTERVVVRDNTGKTVYGSAEGMPALEVASEEDLPELTHGRVEVGEQYANKTSAAQYAGGSVLKNGTFEKGLVGWSANKGAESVVASEGGNPEGARYLAGVSELTQKVEPSSAAYGLLADSGAVLSVWLKGSGSAMLSFAGVSKAVTVTGAWARFELAATATQVKAKSNYVDNLNLSITGNGLSVDHAVLQPGSARLPVNLAVRYTSTLHSELETQVFDGESAVWVTQSLRDELGRPAKKALPFGAQCVGAGCNRRFTSEETVSANAYYDGGDADYPDAGGYAYSETRYEPDQTAVVDQVGLPGAAFSLAGGHVAKTYYQGINLTGVNLLDQAALASAIGSTLDFPASSENPTHGYEATQDADRRWGFRIKDGNGKVVASGARLADGTLAVSVSEYNEKGLLTKSHPPLSCGYTPIPANCVEPSTFAYDDEGRMTMRVESDAGTTLYFYDSQGRLRATCSQEQFAKGIVNVSVYDAFDRVVRTGTWKTSLPESALRAYFADNGNNALPGASDVAFSQLAVYYYDTMPDRAQVLAETGAELYPSTMSVDAFSYGTDKLNAVVTFLPKVAGVSDQKDGRKAVHSVGYRYDKYGKVLETYVYNGLVKDVSLRLQKAETVYDLAGRITHTVKYPKGAATPEADRITERYTYDNLGRVSKITGPGNAVLAEYDYNPAGQVARAWLGGKLLRLELEYHISGALKRTRAQRVADGTVLYDEVLAYEDCGAGAPAGCKAQYGGNIARMAQLLAHGKPKTATERDAAYTYDDLNRLTAVNDAVQDEFDERFGYDAQGRMAWQRRGSLSTSNAGGEYHYVVGKNQLAWVDAGMDEKSARDMSGSVVSPAFLYDLSGNMTDDNSKGMSVVYDDRNMPLSFVRTGANSDYLVENRYDASGNRVSKFVFTRSVTNGSAGAWTFASATHYTGVGNEIREAPDADVKVVVNMPQGLGRYGVNDSKSFEWYLKNHIGNTMLVYNTGATSSVKAAYDYRAFGKRELLAQMNDRVTEEFTGKELDEEVELNYFIHRYYDADLGMWISVDPKRQFASPYLYAGNGINPIRMIDPDGRDGQDVAIYTAIMNGGNPLAVIGGQTAQTMVETASNSPRIFMDMATSNPEATKQYATLMAAPIVGGLMGAGTALAADALATSVPPAALALSNAALSHPEVYIYAREGASALASFLGPPSPCEGLGDCLGAAVSLAYDEIPKIFMKNDSDDN